MKHVAPFLLALAACASDPTPAPDLQLDKLDAFAAEHHVVGVDSDHAGGVWVAYQLQSGPFSWNDLRIVRYSADRIKLAEHRYAGDDVLVNGLAFDGSALWINHSSGSAQNNRLRKLDPATGAELGTLPGAPDLADIDARDGKLLLASKFCEVIALDATTGVETSRIPVTSCQTSDTYGVASSAEGIWVVEMTTQRLVLLDDDGVSQTTVGLPYALDDWTVEDGLHLAVQGDLFILHRRNQIGWYGRTTTP